jgi:hypothetical protein
MNVRTVLLLGAAVAALIAAIILFDDQSQPVAVNTPESPARIESAVGDRSSTPSVGAD